MVSLAAAAPSLNPVLSVAVEPSRKTLMPAEPCPAQQELRMRRTSLALWKLVELAVDSEAAAAVMLATDPRAVESSTGTEMKAPAAAGMNVTVTAPSATAAPERSAAAVSVERQ